MQLDYATPSPRGPRTGLRFNLITFGGGIAGFVAWCAADWAYVHINAPLMGSFDWLLLLFPLAVGCTGAAALRHLPSGSRIGLSLLAALLASGVAVALVLFFGLPFHFWIGGRL
jgi:hypothetical protein